jgi:flagellar hook-associated protein 1 FlgK
VTGTFGSLNAATTALWAQRRALDVTGQNIANVNTEGYSRQRADMAAIGGSAVPAFYSKSPGIGAGVNVDSVTRIRDAFLEGRGHTEHANDARLTVESGAYSKIETAFREPGDTGIQSLMSDMWAAWGDVDNGPKELATRTQVLETLNTLVGGLHFSQASMGAEWNQNRDNLEVLVKDVNSAADTVARLNGAIQRATQQGLPANELKDQRDTLIMKLSEQVGATVRPADNGMLDVVVGGVSLVSGRTPSELAVDGTLDPDTTATLPVRLITKAGQFPVNPGGTAQGQLNVLNTVIPDYRADLNSVAQNLAAALNTQHGNGWDLDGAKGTDLLGPTPPATTITADNIQVLFSDPRKVAASGFAPGATGPVLDSSNADKIAQLRLSSTGADAQYRAMIVGLGVQAAVSERNLGIQQVISTQVDAARESVSGVNIDEEMTNMLSYQHAYSAAGRMITAIDETLDVLINRTGLVGR